MRPPLLLCAALAALAFAHGGHDGAPPSASELAAQLAARFPRLAAAPATTPQQVRLAPGPQPGASMRASWATISPVVNGTPRVSWWPAGQPGAAAAAPAARSTYSAGETGWSGALYSAVMAPLAPGVSYEYSVGTPDETTDVRSFSLPPSGPASHARVAFAADMGTIVPLGWAVADRLVQDHLEGERFDAVVIGGDLSYSTVSPGSKWNDTKPRSASARRRSPPHLCCFARPARRLLRHQSGMRFARVCVGLLWPAD